MPHFKMNDPNLTPQTETPPSLLRCVTGAVISGGLGFAVYSVMIAIATNFATKPIHSDNVLTLRISSAVRTLVVGVFALGSGIFGIVAIGLLALAVQSIIQQLTKPKNS